MRACAAGVECLVCLSVCLLPRARMRSRGRVFGLSVSLFVCQFVCPPLFALFARSRHFQELFVQYTGRSGEKSSL